MDEIEAYEMIWRHNESCNDPDQIIYVPRFHFSGEVTKENMIRIRTDNDEGRIICGPYLVLENLNDIRIFENDDDEHSWPDWFGQRVQLELDKLKKIGIVHMDVTRGDNFLYNEMNGKVYVIDFRYVKFINVCSNDSQGD
ncbi:unnamed protein product [Ambrosiozyma monospora]|uniref:Unnamed protein product n=1 Tax=Ambrosiozyma monospora TaxID=43982 RepID=A0ACB5T843_AMBMO|nr:unnamed protein product [Ambrosiozyma monospora]